MTTDPIVKTTDATRIAGFLPNLQMSGNMCYIFDQPLSDPATYKGKYEGKGNGHAGDKGEPQGCLI